MCHFVHALSIAIKPFCSTSQKSTYYIITMKLIKAPYLHINLFQKRLTEYMTDNLAPVLDFET